MNELRALFAPLAVAALAWLIFMGPRQELDLAPLVEAVKARLEASATRGS